MLPLKSTVSRCTFRSLPLILFALLTTPTVADEKGTPGPVFQDGAQCLFIGHSFFIPVAKRFDSVAKQNNFKSHQADFVFAPGMGGSPGSLWENERHRKRIETKLATGTVDLFGMTATGRLGSGFKHYQQWIELALKYNPKTRIFIGQSWAFGGPKMNSATYKRAIQAASTRLFKTVVQLRNAFPQTPIYFLDYGQVAAEMKDRFDAGQLPDITKVAGFGRSSLFRDGFIGHGGSMMLELSALSWLNLLYGAEIEKLKHTPYQADIVEILSKVMKYNQKFQ